MNKILTKAMALLLATCSVASITACSTVVEDIEHDKSQLYVANYTGGTGEKWLEEVKARFEAAYKDKSFEEGKKGVQIITDSNKSYDGVTLETTMNTSDFDVFFTHSAAYFSYASSGNLLDITSLVTKKTGSDNKTIESKLTEEAKNILPIDGKYYAIPHAEITSANIQYDAGVFKSKNLYFGTAIDTTDTTYPGTRKFVANSSAEKSCGPNGVKGDYDDGLPSTYMEFYKMMDKMTKNNVIPFVWTGKSMHYTNILTDSLLISYLGGDLTAANYDYQSDATLEVIESFTGDTPNVTTITGINEDNANKIRSSAALYYALELCDKVFSNEKNYYRESPLTTYTHLDAMTTFARSGLNGQDHVAMLIDGTYWYNEAATDGIFKDLQANFPYNYTEKEFKVMPLPVKYSGTVEEGKGKAPTMLAGAGSYAFINAKIDEDIIDLAEEFLSFCYTDSELCSFTLATNGIAKAVNYDYSALTDLPSYTKSVLEVTAYAKANGSYVTPLSNNPTYIKNARYFSMGPTSDYWSIKTSNGKVYSGAYDAFTSKPKVSVKDAFLGMALSDQMWSVMRSK